MQLGVFRPQHGPSRSQTHTSCMRMVCVFRIYVNFWPKLFKCTQHFANISFWEDSVSILHALRLQNSWTAAREPWQLHVQLPTTSRCLVGLTAGYTERPSLFGTDANLLANWIAYWMIWIRNWGKMVACITSLKVKARYQGWRFYGIGEVCKSHERSEYGLSNTRFLRIFAQRKNMYLSLVCIDPARTSEHSLF